MQDIKPASIRIPMPDSDEATGKQMYDFIHDLYPLCRSITGEGTLETLRRIKKIIPLNINKIPTGTKVFDWEIPKEWNIQDAYIKDPLGNKIVDFKNSNLHVVNYSAPVDKIVSLSFLKEHLHYLPEHPDWIPYRTSYYNESWGFCMSYNQFKTLVDGDYEVCIDSSLARGHLNYGEYVIKGKSNDEVLISTHICHPSLCNDNLSGIAVISYLARYLQSRKLHYTYRFIFIPGTIGAITWLAINEKHVDRVKHGLVAALLGRAGGFTYKKSRREHTEMDQVVEYVLAHDSHHNSIRSFEPYGYDERQFCSPGFDLPVGCLTRTPHGEFPEYHTSADNLDLVKPEALEESFNLYLKVISMLEANRYYTNVSPKGEPQLGKYGLYDSIGGQNNTKQFQLALLWVLNYADGKHSLLDIAKKSNIPFDVLDSAAVQLTKAHLLKVDQLIVNKKILNHENFAYP